MDFQKICDTLKSCPEVAQTFPHADVVKYIELVALLKSTPALAYLQPSYQLVLWDPDETAKLAWEQFREIAWGFEPTADDQKANLVKHVKLFLIHGLEHRIGVLRCYLLLVFALILAAESLSCPTRLP
ncbi:hypothetical protein B0H16DRAFT_1458791 [Mycena metata]|uniref:Uncharacterized protein n=1 Tax=Mycena metata TaxID=1033252 RepID=A0AAD7J539_9AGAR|nr:hypothetical protein B0H16DRAFT_1458787 [Mycena metata]KAJ7755252.1 hypothetical protein B0H16DRAFT_1458791 [Mycena metata]